ncbi:MULTISPECIES: hypothetical protein [unclassified Brenneria]|uniref:hypothetical protein n=1 Tax=unclassified Brenneria TaxID=2634434 RepID=UPI0018F09203|nr:hypothetical protein [Brenneria sp. L3-3C-1]MBJ7223899.1 hypothetical protein [Brenneria sp. L3-3C-1]MEE3645144.1 hypothetical protein [Brenneria sp. L3_3C_1]
MMQTLINASLSAEAKAVVAHAYNSGVSQSVTTIIEVENERTLSDEILHEFIVAGWGEELAKYTEFREVPDATNCEAIRQVQLSVQNGAALFAICKVVTNDYNRYYLSIHHALADEKTLSLIKNIVNVFCVGKSDIALKNMNQGRLLYRNYIERQRILAKTEKCVSYQSMIPVRLSQTGPIAWNKKCTRINIHRRIKVGSTNNEVSLLNKILPYLCDAGVISEGSIACSSHDWRLPYESAAIGMMTGLVALPVNTGAMNYLQTSLESCIRYHSTMSEVLRCCRASELFINGSMPRGIPSSQVVGSIFPVGINIQRINSSEFRLDMEGPFCSRSAVNNLLINLTEALSERRK